MPDAGPAYAPGAAVRVRWLKDTGHLRIPYYTRGRTGEVAQYVGSFLNPEQLAVGDSAGPAIPLYRVRFRQTALWPDYAGPPADTLTIEIYEHWLEEAMPP